MLSYTVVKKSKRTYTISILINLVILTGQQVDTCI